MTLSHLFHPVPPRDWIAIVALFAGIFLLVGIAEAIRRGLKWPAEFTRKLIHILVGLMTALATLLLSTSLPLALMGAFFSLANALALKKGLFKSMHGARESYGTALYPFSFLILVLFAWPDHKPILVASMLVLALGDAGAAIVGESLRSPRNYTLIADPKSIAGSLAMFLITGLVLFLTFHLYPPHPSPSSPATLLWIAILTALYATAAEALGHRGSDNLSIPLSTAVLLYYMTTHSPAENLQLTLGALFGGAIALASCRLKFLDGGGAVAMFLLAVPIFGFGGWKWTLPILTFFILSSLLSRLGRSAKARYDLIFEKGSRRDHAQVLANGGVAGALMVLTLFSDRPQIYLYYCAALAAATADTWATEIGTLSRQSPRLITSLRPVPAGTSGGVTLTGLIGAFVGALVIGLSGWTTFQTGATPLLLLVAASGLLASLVDSLLGATLQIQYRCPVCEKITEKQRHCDDRDTVPVSGMAWMNNDMVNFLSTGSAVLFAYLGMLWTATG